MKLRLKGYSEKAIRELMQSVGSDYLRFTRKADPHDKDLRRLIRAWEIGQSLLRAWAKENNRTNVFGLQQGKIDVNKRIRND